MAMEVKETGAGTEGNNNNDGGVVRWEKFLPKMVMRVLLVEADDSTRQIVTALLRKCSYKVAAVSDGLKAWELLKGRPHDIDLILTEVELQSISGFALLTLIAEHEVCKNIPVIMMSAHDSVSTVYKCMLRGAADFLVKPVRKNELKNLWQHVWRRQASSSGGPKTTSDGQQKVEATAENSATSNHSSGYEACIQRNGECIEKGSDAQSSCTKRDLEPEGALLGQSSCTKRDLEPEGALLGHRQDLSQLKLNTSQLCDTEIEQCIEGSERKLMHDGEAQGSVAVPSIKLKTITLRVDTAADSQWGCANATSEAFDNNNGHVNSSREAIDLIGTFDSNPKCSYRSSGSNYGTNKVDSSSLLDLSLRRSHPSGSVNQVMDDRHRLKQSNASAFSRYVSRTFQPLHSTSVSICNQQRGYETNSDKQISHQDLDYNSVTRGSTVGHDNNMISLATGQPGQAEMQLPYPQVNQIYPFSPEARSSQQLKYLMDQNIHNACDQMDQKKRQKLDPLEDQHFSSATDQSGSGSFCNDSLSRFNSINSGSNDNGNTVSVFKVAADCGNETTLIHDGNCHRSMQREAALTKFRLKRKDRCYEKKVRYESRKNLQSNVPE